jgi:phenylpyruvate tautomerase PptA (4-oxalocrotonate tautomerase family)
MPVVSIKGPSGLNKSLKKELIEGALRTLSETYQMPDDRVYIEEIPTENVGHTPLLAVTGGEHWAVQSEPARIYVEICAPPGLPIEAKRKLMRELTQIAGRAWGRSNLRDVPQFDSRPLLACLPRRAPGRGNRSLGYCERQKPEARLSAAANGAMSGLDGLRGG